MQAEIIEHPAVTAESMIQKRLFWLQRAALFKRKGDEVAQSYCQGKASGLDEAIVMLGGKGISLSLADYETSLDNGIGGHGK